MKITKIFNWILIIISIIGGLILFKNKVIIGDLYGSLIRLLIIPIILAPKIINLFFKKKITLYTETIYILFIFTSYFLGSVYNLYYRFPGYDKLMHWLSGIMTSYLAIIILVKLKKYDSKSILFNIIFIIAISLMVAGLWEFFEYTCDRIFEKDAQRVIISGINDTMLDMIVAFLGSLLFSILYIYEEITHKKIIIKKYIDVISNN